MQQVAKISQNVYQSQISEIIRKFAQFILICDLYFGKGVIVRYFMNIELKKVMEFNSSALFKRPFSHLYIISEERGLRAIKIKEFSWSHYETLKYNNFSYFFFDLEFEGGNNTLLKDAEIYPNIIKS